MKDPFTKGYVNWVDGMKISREHFIQLQSAAEQRLKDARSTSLNHTNFGLLSSGIDGKNPLEVNVLIESGKHVKVEVNQCRGITESGDRIEVLHRDLNEGSKQPSELIELSEDDLKAHDHFFLTIRVHQNEMTPYGVPDQEEAPVRYPYTRPTLKIEVVPPEEDNHTLFKNSLVIGRLHVQNGELLEDESYIPPCTNMAATADLQEFAFEYIRFLGSMEDDLFKIFSNLNRKEKLTSLAESVRELMISLISTIQADLDFYKMYGSVSSPATFVLNAKRIARCLKNSINLRTNDAKEELLNYIQEIVGISPGEYVGLNNKILTMEYNHFYIRDLLQSVLQFCQINSKLMSEWSNLDYIGKKKKSDIFVGEVTQDAKSEQGKKKWDF